MNTHVSILVVPGRASAVRPHAAPPPAPRPGPGRGRTPAPRPRAAPGGRTTLATVHACVSGHWTEKPAPPTHKYKQKHVACSTNHGSCARGQGAGPHGTLYRDGARIRGRASAGACEPRARRCDTKPKAAPRTPSRLPHATPLRLGLSAALARSLFSRSLARSPLRSPSPESRPSVT